MGKTAVFSCTCRPSSSRWWNVHVQEVPKKKPRQCHAMQVVHTETTARKWTGSWCVKQTHTLFKVMWNYECCWWFYHQVSEEYSIYLKCALQMVETFCEVTCHIIPSLEHVHLAMVFMGLDHSNFWGKLSCRMAIVKDLVRVAKGC